MFCQSLLSKAAILVLLSVSYCTGNQSGDDFWPLEYENMEGITDIGLRKETLLSKEDLFTFSFENCSDTLSGVEKQSLLPLFKKNPLLNHHYNHTIVSYVGYLPFDTDNSYFFYAVSIPPYSNTLYAIRVVKDAIQSVLEVAYSGDSSWLDEERTLKLKDITQKTVKLELFCEALDMMIDDKFVTSRTKYVVKFNRSGHIRSVQTTKTDNI